MAGPESPKTSARVAFNYPGFVHFQLARFCTVVSTEMQSVAVGWQVYEITRRPMDLGFVGLAQLVPEEHFPSAIAWASSVFQFATILGPSLGGVVYAAFRGPSAVYALGLIAAAFAVLATLQIKTQSQQRLREPVNLETILAGFHYIWHEKLIL